MAWVKIDDQFADHPKIIAVGPLAAWLYVCGLTYCGRYLTDGFIPEGQTRKLADVENPSELVAKLVATGLWVATEDGYIVHDYLEYNPTAEEVKATRQSRSNAGRKGGIASGESKRKAKAKANAIAKEKQNQTPSPSPSPLDTNTKSAKTALTSFPDWLKALEKPETIGEKNGLAVLLRMGKTLYDNFPDPSKSVYSRVGGLAKIAGSHAQLAKVFWNFSSTPMAVPLDYLTKVVNNPGQFKPNTPPPKPVKIRRHEEM
jgi:hypothetical protein